jgi:hypothetical protein
MRDPIVEIEVAEPSVGKVQLDLFAQTALVTKIATKLIAGTAVSNEELHTRSIRAKVLPLPEPFRRLISQNLTRAFLRAVNDFLFDVERRDAMERSLLDRLAAGGGPFIIIAHSQGSMIAYDVLRRIKPPQLKIRLAIGSAGGPGRASTMDRRESAFSAVRGPLVECRGPTRSRRIR